MRKALMGVLLTGLFLLLLSALVVSPEETAEPMPLPPREYHAAFLPMTALNDAAAGQLQSPQPEAREAAAGVLLAAAVCCLCCVCDSNGRVLTAARYENSVYQVFRPEVAGG